MNVPLVHTRLTRIERNKNPKPSQTNGFNRSNLLDEHSAHAQCHKTKHCSISFGKKKEETLVRLLMNMIQTTFVACDVSQNSYLME